MPNPHPIVNLNGTSLTALQEQAQGVLNALRRLDEAMKEAFPNGRDYQLSEHGDLAASVEAHKAQNNHILQAMDFWQNRLEFLADQRDEREAQRRG